MSDRRSRRLLAALLVFGAALRLLWVVLVTRVPEGRHDPGRYLLHAIDLAEGRGYQMPRDGTPTAYYPVGYPLVLSLLFRVVGLFRAPDHETTSRLMAAAWHDRLGDHAETLGYLVWTGTLFNAVLGVASIALVFWIARRLAGTGPATLAAALTAGFPNLIFHTGVLLTETLFIFVLLAALALLLAVPWRGGEPRPARLLGFGLLVGAAALVRPLVLALLPALPVAVLAGRLGWRRAGVATALTLLGALLVIAPWSLRNLRVMGAPIAISTNLGDNLCVGHYPGAPGHFVIIPVCEGSTPYGEPTLNPEWEVRRSAELRAKALKFAWRHRWDEPALLARKLYFLMRHDHSGLSAVESHGKDRFLGEPLRGALGIIADGYYYGVLALGLPGLLVMTRRPWEPRRILLVLSALALAAAPLAFFGYPRFHLPLLPLLAIAAAIAVSRLAARRSARA